MLLRGRALRVKGLRGAFERRDTNDLGTALVCGEEERGELGGRGNERGDWGTSTRPARTARAGRPARRAPGDSIHQLQSTLAAKRPSPSRMRHPPIMSDAKPPITTVDTRARSTQQYGLHSSWDQECAGKAKRVAKTETAKNATESTRERLI